MSTGNRICSPKNPLWWSKTTTGEVSFLLCSTERCTTVAGQWWESFQVSFHMLPLVSSSSAFSDATSCNNFIHSTQNNNEIRFYSWGRNPQRSSCYAWFRYRSWHLYDNWSDPSWRLLMTWAWAALWLVAFIFIAIHNDHDEDDDDQGGGTLIPAVVPTAWS